MSSRVSPLRQLVDLISHSVTQIDEAFAKAELDYPSLNAPFNPTSPAEVLVMSPDLINANKVVVAACAQLSATIGSPGSNVFGVIGGFQVAAALRAVLEGNTVEILKETPSGVDVKAISAANGMDAAKLARILRLLCTHHIFREVSPDVFCNNRISSLMDTGKSVKAIKADPLNKYTQSTGLGGIFEHSTDIPFKGAGYLSEVLLDPKLGSSDLPEHAPAMIALKSPISIWEWYEEPENERYFKRFSAAMSSVGKVDPPNSILQGFKWGDLPTGSVIVDVGGGMGHHTLKIAKIHKHLKAVVQDRAAVIEQAKAFWNENFPDAISSGNVELQVHNFFDPQPITSAAVFLVRAILHDWGKSKSVEILSQLRAAATPATKLVLIEGIVPYACLNERVKELSRDIPGSEQIEPPHPLLPNFGKAGAMSYVADIQMLVELNGEERTLGSLVDLATASGWKILEVIRIPGSMTSHIVAVPSNV